MLRLIPIVVLAVLLVPIGAGTLSAVLSGFGWAPELGNDALGLDAIWGVLDTPGIGKSIWLSFWIGLVASALSLLIVVLFVASFSGSRLFGLVSSAIRPVLAVPHAAAAFGLLFLIAPSGFLIRLVSPELTGFERPPDWLLVNDPEGLAMLAGLVIKEIPFLFFVTLAALSQTEPRYAQLSSSMGYGRIWGWLTSVFPSVYRQIRLPVFAVIAFATSTVDVALVLGPVTPPPLSIRILRWMNDPDLSLRLMAGAGAIIQMGITVFALVCWWLGEKFVAGMARRMALGGLRCQRDTPVRAVASILMIGSVGLVLVGIVIVALWSFAGVWRFPDALPSAFTLSSWVGQQSNLIAVALRSAQIAIASSLIGLALALAGLENEYRANIHVTPRVWFLIYLPLLVPQIAFLGGLSFVFLNLGFDGSFWSVVLVHIVFVFPYIYLTLADPWKAFDVRYLAVARTLGKSYNYTFWTIRLPIMLRPVLAALALGFAVSIAQYLPTLLIGAGRQPTITTEAVALASGGNRRLIGIYALVQTLLPFIAFVLAGLVPLLTWRNRRALQAGEARW